MRRSREFRSVAFRQTDSLANQPAVDWRHDDPGEPQPDAPRTPPIFDPAAALTFVNSITSAESAIGVQNVARPDSIWRSLSHPPAVD